jgi:hypothetical protein
VHSINSDEGKNMRKLYAAVLIAAVLGAGMTQAQNPAPANVTVKEVQPGLLEATGPRVHEAVGAGIQKITAAPGKDISVQSPWGHIYFAVAQGREAGGLHDRDRQEWRGHHFGARLHRGEEGRVQGLRSTPSCRWRSPRRRARRKARRKAEASGASEA